MRIRRRQVLWGLSALTATSLLAACSADGPTEGGASTREASTMASPTSATPATAVAAPPTAQGPRTEKWVDLEVGDCLADPPPADPSVVTVTVVDCATAHMTEVYFRAPVAVNAAIDDVANQQCAAGFTQYTGRSVDGSPFALRYLIDSHQDRTSANPDPSTVICLLQAANGQTLTESARR
jgi:hypothetical protein